MTPHFFNLFVIHMKREIENDVKLPVETEAFLQKGERTKTTLDKNLPDKKSRIRPPNKNPANH